MLQKKKKRLGKAQVAFLSVDKDHFILGSVENS